MTTHFVANVSDLDAVFAPYVSGAKADPTFLYVGSQDLKDRYQKYTSGPKAAITYFTDTGVDLKDIFAPIADEFTVVVVPTDVNGYEPVGPGTISEGAEAFPSGGTGPYTYAWTFRSGSTAITINNAALKAPTWTLTTTTLAAIRIATWRVTVTDSLSATTFVDVVVTLQVGGEPP